jgi:COMM domain containing 7
MVKESLQVNPLLDMDWRFGVNVSSSECEKIGATYLQLQLTIGKEDVFVEFTLPQFYEFLHEMEKANTTLKFFS